MEDSYQEGMLLLVYLMVVFLYSSCCFLSFSLIWGALKDDFEPIKKTNFSLGKLPE